MSVNELTPGAHLTTENFVNLLKKDYTHDGPSRQQQRLRGDVYMRKHVGARAWPVRFV